MEELFAGAIQSDLKGSLEAEHLLFIDDVLIKCEGDLEKEFEETYSHEIFSENTRVHFKLQVNLREFLLLGHELHPTLVKFLGRNDLKK
jgi:hypothetical protein